MSATPLSPAPVTAWEPGYLPAYVSNGVLGLRVNRVPLFDGIAIASGFSGVHPVDRVEGFARAPFPLAGDIFLGEARLAEQRERVQLVRQEYDFTCGELRTLLRCDAGRVTTDVEVLTLCSRTLPTIALQEVTLTVDRACDVTLVGAVDPAGIPGSWQSRDVEPAAGVDGSLRWESHGALCTVGAAYTTELLGAPDARRTTDAAEVERLATSYAFRGRRGRRYRLRQIASLVPDALHQEPDRQAIRLVHAAALRGFDAVRAENRRAWEELWQARVRLVGASRRWQELADAAFFYLHTSAHASSPSSTSMFGLSYWPDYHYYRGHVMWDIETFAVPPLLLTDPHAARALLRYRARRLAAAQRNAAMAGYRGAQFPWESSPRYGEEAAPDGGVATGREHHVSADVAHAFAQFVHATGDAEFARELAWPVLRDVARWIESRVTRTRRGHEILGVTGVAEKERVENNSAFTNVGAITVLREAVALAGALGATPDERWSEIARTLVVPIDHRTHVMRNYDGHRATDEKGHTPDAAAALLLFGYDAGPEVEEATFRRAVELADGYAGSPMLSALLGVFAARLGERERALELFERGYGDFVTEPFATTLEYGPDVFPEQERAGPFTANLAGFLLACLYGLTGVRVGPDEPAAWCRRRPLLPRGWRSIEVERLWARGRPAGLVARHGDDRARLQVE